MTAAFVRDTFLRLLEGVPITVQVALLSTAAGFVLALLLLFARLSGLRWLVAASDAYVFVFRGTPLLVVLYLVYYAPGQFRVVRESPVWPFLREPLWCALLALTLVTAAFGREILRGGLASVPGGTVEAARALGMRRALIYRKLILPLALRNALPAYGNEILIMVKATSLVSVITLMDVTGIAYRIISDTYRVTPVFVIAGGIYLALNATVVVLLAALERRLYPERRDPPRPPRRVRWLRRGVG